MCSVQSVTTNAFDPSTKNEGHYYTNSNLYVPPLFASHMHHWPLVSSVAVFELIELSRPVFSAFFIVVLWPCATPCACARCHGPMLALE